MRLTINHKDPEIREKASEWLYEQPYFSDNADELLGEKLFDAFAESDIWELEHQLSLYFDESIELKKDLIFIEL